MLAFEIEKAKKRLGLTWVEYARRVGLAPQTLYKIKAGRGVDGRTLAALQKRGGVRITRRLIDSLDSAA